jgi:hypothetical protein
MGAAIRSKFLSYEESACMETTKQSLPWLADLTEHVRRELNRLAESQDRQEPALEEEKCRLQTKLKGWSESLAKTDLSLALRTVIEADCASALYRIQEIDNRRAEEKARRRQIEDLLDLQAVIDRFQRLPEALATNNPALGNLELSLHIARIDCFADGSVVMRTCKLGALAGSLGLIASDASRSSPRSEPGVRDEGVHRTTPRRRARLCVRTDDAAGVDLDAAADLAADPNHFAGLDEAWFWDDRFQVPRKKSWAEENAAEIGRLRASGMTIAALSAHFGKSIPLFAFRCAAPPNSTARLIRSQENAAATLA